MIFVLMGAPGAGKGTQAKLLADKDSTLCKVSTGDSLRKHVKNKTTVGKKIDEIMSSGKLVSDEILFEVVKHELDACEKYSGIILDGYPRNLEQAKTLTELLKTTSEKQVAKVLLLHVEKDDLIKRISGRRICDSCGATFHVETSPCKNEGTCNHCGGQVVQRKDDSIDKVSIRLGVYEDETKPVVDYYKQLGILEVVDGSLSSDQVYGVLKKTIQRVA